MNAPSINGRAVLAGVALLLAPAAAWAADVNEATQNAMKAASARVAPSVVTIETSGGLEVIGGGKKGPPGAGGGIRKGVGPTTGVIVDPEGYIITSSFNFAHKPTAINVTVPGRARRFTAVEFATDQTRMLTLLKLNLQKDDPRDFPVPDAFPKKDVEVGQWAMALGRTSDPNTDHPPSMSVGIISAVNRIWGKAVQTDAKTSPVNYGGPLVSIDGRVYGVVVPMSNRAEGETAGVDVYDGGIGFAVPLEDVRRVLPRLKEKEGTVLRRGLLGITPQGTDVYNASPVIGAIQPDSAAARAGLQVGDTVLEVDGKKIPNYSTVQHVLGPMYDGDEIVLKVKRGDKEMEFKGVKLQGTATAYVNAFLGVLPMRDDPGPGVEVRYVYPKSPAEAAGIKAGDRVMKLGVSGAAAPKGPKGPALAPIQNRAAFLAAMQRFTPGTEITLEVRRSKAARKDEKKDGRDEAKDEKKDGKEGDPKAAETETVTVSAKLVAAPAELPDKLPLPSSAGRALEGQPKKKDPKLPFDKLPFEKKPPEGENGDCQDNKDEPKKDDRPKVETGFMTRTNEGLGREYWVYVPDNYDRNKSYGLIVWFHGAGQGGKDGERMSRAFREVCEDHNFIMMGPKSGNNDGWVPSETELVVRDVRTVISQYTIDRTRVVAHGMGNGGQMAFYVGFNARDVIRGVATVGAVLGTNPKENVANQPLSFFIAAGDKDPLAKDVVASKDLLVEKRFPVFYREMKESGKEYFDAPTFADFLAWVDSLDRI